MEELKYNIKPEMTGIVSTSIEDELQGQFTELQLKTYEQEFQLQRKRKSYLDSLSCGGISATRLSVLLLIVLILVVLLLLLSFWPICYMLHSHLSAIGCI